MLSSEGRIVYKSNGNTWFTETQVKDHASTSLSTDLGSVRAVCSLNSTNRSRITRQVDSYYPFGMNIKELSQTSDAYLANEYMYNGKMYQDEMGLGLLDYGARFYDAVLGRWHSVDPMAEKHQDYSQYAYVYNNPIRLIDPIGMDSIIFNENYECTEIYRNDNSNCGYLPDGTMFNMNEQDADNMVIYNEATKYSDLKKNGNMINKVELLPNDLVEYFLKASGSEDQNILTAYYYALTESPGGRKLDFTFAYNLADKSTMYVMDLDGKKFGQNDYNTGNSLWGAAMQRMGIDLSTALLCANLYEISRGNIGDSSDDQKSIIFGYNWATKNKKK